MIDFIDESEKICDAIERLYGRILTISEMLRLIIQYEKEILDVQGN